VEEAFETIAGNIALAVEEAAILMVALGAVEGLVRLARAPLSHEAGTLPRRELWLRFAGWILLSLEFALGADIIRTVISPRPRARRRIDGACDRLLPRGRLHRKAARCSTRTPAPFSLASPGGNPPTKRCGSKP
jgi:uncharacterized membrane protein